MGTTTRVSVSSTGEEGNDYSESPVISADGRYVAFVSDAANLTPGVPDGLGHVYLRDILIGTTSRVSVSSKGEQANGGCEVSGAERQWPLPRLRLVLDQSRTGRGHQRSIRRIPP
jgi:Tol biopolymer transport system component